MRWHLRTNNYKMKIFELYNSPQQKILSFKPYQKPLIESLLCVLINRIKKSDSKVTLRKKYYVVKYCETACFAERKSYSAGKRRIFHDVIVHFSSLRGKCDERRYHDVKTMAKWPKGIRVTWSLFYRALTLLIYGN